MTLPATFPLALSQIKTEFSGPNNLRAYLGGGAYVLASTGVPASGPLKFSDFFGKSAVIPPTIFVSSGSYTVPAGVTSLRVVAAGGGGGGGAAWQILEGGGGGGAGGLIDVTDYTVTPGQVLSVVIGAGGTGGNAGFDGWGQAGYNGANSTISSLVAFGGGGGAGGARGPYSGANGGSGGGRDPYYNQGTVGLGMPGQGNNGGAGQMDIWAGGGGGAGGVGDAGGAGYGGAGLLKTINGINYPLAAGGGGGGGSNQPAATPGRPGGFAVGSATAIGGHGASYTGAGVTAGMTNTGSGGGGNVSQGGNGGSGIVFIVPNATAGSGALYPTYSITGVSALNEDGGNVNFTIHTTNVSNGTVLYYTIVPAAVTTGVNDITIGDFMSGSLSGSATISGGLGTISLAGSPDLFTEGVESFNIWLRTGSVSGPVVYVSTAITINNN